MRSNFWFTGATQALDITLWNRNTIVCKRNSRDAMCAKTEKKEAGAYLQWEQILAVNKTTPGKKQTFGKEILRFGDIIFW